MPTEPLPAPPSAGDTITVDRLRPGETRAAAALLAHAFLDEPMGVPVRVITPRSENGPLCGRLFNERRG